MNWPGDADGDVLRRLESDGCDFSKPHLIDFWVDFAGWPPSPEAVALLKSRFPSVRSYDPEGDNSGYLLFKISVLVSYELVTRIQREISALMQPFGGVCNSWGVLL